MIKVLILLFTLTGFFRGLSFAVWNIKDKNIAGGIAVIVLNSAAFIFCVMNLIFE